MCLPFVHKTPVKLLFERVALMWGQKTLVLKAANYDSRPDANSLCEVVYRIICEGLFSDEVGQRTWWNKQVSCKAISLSLELLHFWIDHVVGQVFDGVVDDEGTLVSVKEDVTNFMKESKPELMVSFVTHR